MCHLQYHLQPPATFHPGLIDGHTFRPSIENNLPQFSPRMPWEDKCLFQVVLFFCAVPRPAPSSACSLEAARHDDHNMVAAHARQLHVVRVDRHGVRPLQKHASLVLLPHLELRHQDLTVLRAGTGVIFYGVVLGVFFAGDAYPWYTHALWPYTSFSCYAGFNISSVREKSTTRCAAAEGITGAYVHQGSSAALRMVLLKKAKGLVMHHYLSDFCRVAVDRRKIEELQGNHSPLSFCSALKKYRFRQLGAPHLVAQFPPQDE